MKHLTQPTSPSEVKTELLTVFSSVFHHKAAQFRAVCCICSNYKAISCIFYLFLFKNLHYLPICYRIKVQIPLLGIQSPFQFESTYLSSFISHYSSWGSIRAKPLYSLLKRQHIPTQPSLAITPPTSCLTFSTWINPSHLQGPDQAPAPAGVVPNYDTMCKKALCLWNPVCVM